MSPFADPAPFVGPPTPQAVQAAQYNAVGNALANVATGHRAAQSVKLANPIPSGGRGTGAPTVSELHDFGAAIRAQGTAPAPTPQAPPAYAPTVTTSTPAMHHMASPGAGGGPEHPTGSPSWILPAALIGAALLLGRK